MQMTVATMTKMTCVTIGKCNICSIVLNFLRKLLGAKNQEIIAAS